MRILVSEFDKKTGKRKRNWALLFEPRDCWSGFYWDKKYFYVCLVWCLPVRINREQAER